MSKEQNFKKHVGGLITTLQPFLDKVKADKFPEQREDQEDPGKLWQIESNKLCPISDSNTFHSCTEHPKIARYGIQERYTIVYYPTKDDENGHLIVQVTDGEEKWLFSHSNFYIPVSEISKDKITFAREVDKMEGQYGMSLALEDCLDDFIRICKRFPSEKFALEVQDREKSSQQAYSFQNAQKEIAEQEEKNSFKYRVSRL